MEQALAKIQNCFECSPEEQHGAEFREVNLFSHARAASLSRPCLGYKIVQTSARPWNPPPIRPSAHPPSPPTPGLVAALPTPLEQLRLPPALSGAQRQQPRTGHGHPHCRDRRPGRRHRLARALCRRRGDALSLPARGRATDPVGRAADGQAAVLTDARRPARL